MKYRVRNAAGELEFASFAQLQQAAAQGFVEQEDEVLKEGEAEWKRASSLAGLWNKPSRHASMARWLRLAKIYFALAGSGAAWWFIHRGEYGIGLLLAFAVVGVLFNITATAQTRPPPS